MDTNKQIQLMIPCQFWRHRELKKKKKKHWHLSVSRCDSRFIL